MKIVYFKVADSIFILADQKIIEKHFTCKVYKINMSSPLIYAISLLKLFFFLLFSGWKYKLFYIRFADWHTALIALFKMIYRRKLIVVIGGFDVACIPELKYGAHVRKIRSILVKYTLRKADLLLPNHHKLINYESTYGLKNIHYGGIKSFVNIPDVKIKVMYNGFDSSKFHASTSKLKEDIAITVAKISNERTFKLKGIDSFIEVARTLPDKKFIVIGLSGYLVKKLGLSIPGNLTLIQHIPHDKLIQYYQRSKVFCLFSLSEGMPNVLCEAMLCECIPIGSNVSSIPDIIGENGLIIVKRDTAYIKEQLQKAFSLPREVGQSARESIKSKFSIQNREQELVKNIQIMLKQHEHE